MTRLDPIATTPIPPGGPSATFAPAAAPELDAFARTAGADAAVGDGAGLVRVYAIFSLDPSTHEVRVRVVDERGRLVRTIPPETVAAMLAAMADYAGR